MEDIMKEHDAVMTLLPRVQVWDERAREWFRRFCLDSIHVTLGTVIPVEVSVNLVFSRQHFSEGVRSMKTMTATHESSLKSKGFDDAQTKEIDQACQNLKAAGFDWAKFIDALVQGGIALWDILKPIFFPVTP